MASTAQHGQHEQPATASTTTKSALRLKADRARALRCRTLVCVLENPTKVDNIGAVLRNIDGLGIAKVYIVSNHDLVLGRPGRRSDEAPSSALQTASAGASRWVYTRQFTTTAACLEHLRQTGFVSIVTSPHTAGRTNVALRDGDFTGYRKLAVWFGNEVAGITPEAMAQSVACLQIDMCGIAESLNLAVATGIVLHSIAEQRRAFVGAPHASRQAHGSSTDGGE